MNFQRFFQEFNARFVLMEKNVANLIVLFAF